MIASGGRHLRVLWIVAAVAAPALTLSFGADSKGSFQMNSIPTGGSSSLDDLIMNAQPIKEFPKMVEKEGQELYRDHNFLGTISDTNWHGVPSEKVHKFSENFAVEMASKDGTFFRGQQKTRGSSKNLYMKTKPWPHEPNKKGTQGCGNPVCVIIDRKPRRFRDLCQFKSYLESENRVNQVNYVQKGDCYQIIDDKKGGAEKLPWTNKGAIQDNCAACLKDQNCHGNVILNIDIANIFLGFSSAFGGPKFHEHERGSKRMSGLPVEFSCICDAMKFLESMDNLNVKTQVIGVAFGTTCDIFPVEGDQCLWTEWFDHDTPCNSDEDVENHNNHKAYLDISYTAPLRICMPENVHSYQHIGGSEITRVDAKDAINGNALGVDCCGVAKDNMALKFKQVIKSSALEVSCRNKEQQIKQLPPPYIYNDDKNNTCLDYKARYCCKSQAMYRATPIESVLGRFKVSYLPAGPAYATYTLDTKGNVNSVKVTIAFGKKGEIATIIDISQQGYDGKYIAKYQEGNSQAQFVVEAKFDRTSGNVIKATFFLDTPMKSGPIRVGEIEVTIDQGVDARFALNVKIASSNKLTSETRIERDNDGTSTEKPEPTGSGSGSGNKYPGGSTMQTTIVNPQGEKQTITLQLLGGGVVVLQKSEGVCTIPTVEGLDDGDLYVKLEKFTKVYNIKILIESPPLATLFAECDWKDYINLDYPNMREGLNGEYELRMEAYKNEKFAQHACGKNPEEAHYVDAITVEDQVPWAELQMGNARYETFKLTPFFGYACKDANGQPEFCLDMKVRYCCAKEMRAQWGEWGAWGMCSAECGGGIRERKRECKQSKLAKSSKKYNPVCHGMEEWQSDCTKKRFTSQQSECAVEACPVDFKWGHWCPWSQCSISCGQGTKERKRICIPAEGGGKDCPDWRKEKTLFWETTPCAEKDCERFGTTLWSSWTACSVTCGVGQAQRTRGCMSDLTLKVVKNEMCANEPKHFVQTKQCSLQECPVDGGWTEWSIWTMCSQSCVHYPDQGTTVQDSAAFRTRKRYCSNPIPSFGGKECVPDKKFKFVSEEKAEEDKTDCITEKNIPDGYKGKIVPWCPEHCIYSLWGDWSLCSFTCIKVNVKDNIKISPADGYEAALNTNSLESVDYQFTHASYTLPKRSRVRVLVKKERFGGKCPEKEANYDTPSSQNGTVIRQDEDCKLCLEHCPKSLGNPLDIKSIRDYPKLEYPGKDPKCVGYCPISCQMGGWERTKDCTQLIEKEMQNNVKKYKDKPELHNCWVSQAILVASEKAQPKIVDGLHEAFVALGKDIQAVKKPTTSEDLVYDNEKADALSDGKVSALEAIKKENREVFNAIRRELREDVENYIALMENVEKRAVLPPVLEGLFGGESCKLNSDGKEKTVYSGPNIPKSGSKETHTYNVREGSSAFPCVPTPCKPRALDVQEGTAQTGCDIAMWGPWKPWGKCTEKCGDKGTRPRIRDCISVCKNEKIKDDLCIPYKDSVSGKTWSNKYTGPCTPCPEEVVGTWSEWSQWTSTQEFKCSSNHKDGYNLERKKECIAGTQIKTCPEYKGAKEGVVTEKMVLPAGKCPPDNSYWQQKGTENNGGEEQGGGGGGGGEQGNQPSGEPSSKPGGEKGSK